MEWLGTCVGLDCHGMAYVMDIEFFCLIVHVGLYVRFVLLPVLLESAFCPLTFRSARSSIAICDGLSVLGEGGHV